MGTKGTEWSVDIIVIIVRGVHIIEVELIIEGPGGKRV